MIGYPERVKIQRSSIPKIRKIHSCVWKLQVKYSKTSQFWPKNDQIFVLNGQNFAKSEISRHIEYEFLKEDHKNNFHTKVWKLQVKNSQNCQFWPSESHEDTTSCKKLEKNIERSRLQDWNGHTDQVRTHARE